MSDRTYSTRTTAIEAAIINTQVETYIPHGTDLATLNRIGFRYQGLQPDQFTIQVLPIIVRDLISKDLNQLANGKVTGLFERPTFPGGLVSFFNGDRQKYERAKSEFTKACRAHDEDVSKINLKFVKIRNIFSSVVPYDVQDLLSEQEEIKTLIQMVDFLTEYLTAGNKIGRGIAFHHLLNKAIEAKDKTFKSSKDGSKEFKKFRDNFINQVHTVIMPCENPTKSSSAKGKARVPVPLPSVQPSGGDATGTGGSATVGSNGSLKPTTTIAFGTGSVIETSMGRHMTIAELNEALQPVPAELTRSLEEEEEDIEMASNEEQGSSGQSPTLAMMVHYNGVPSDRKALPKPGCGGCNGCKSNNAESILVGIISIVLIATSLRTELCRDLHERLAGGHVDSFKKLDDWLVDQDKNLNLYQNDRTQLVIRVKPVQTKAMQVMESGSTLDLSVDNKGRYKKTPTSSDLRSITWEQCRRGETPCLRHNPEFIANHPSKGCIYLEREKNFIKQCKVDDNEKKSGSGGDLRPQYNQQINRKKAELVNKQRQYQSLASQVEQELSNLNNEAYAANGFQDRKGKGPASKKRKNNREYEGNLVLAQQTTSADLDDFLGVQDHHAFFVEKEVQETLDQILGNNADLQTKEEGGNLSGFRQSGSLESDSDESEQDEKRDAHIFRFQDWNNSGQSLRYQRELCRSYESDLADQTTLQLNIHPEDAYSAKFATESENTGSSNLISNIESNAFMIGQSGDHRALKAYLDSGATDTMVPGAQSRRLFSTYNEVDGRSVTVADGNKAMIHGSGTLKLPISVAGRTLEIEDVLHVPDLKHSLISPHKIIQQLQSRGAATAIVFTIDAAYLMDISKKPIYDHVVGSHKMAVEHNSTYEMVQVTELLDSCNMDEDNKVRKTADC